MSGPPTLDAQHLLADMVADVRWPDGDAAFAAREQQPVGAGRAAELIEWLAATQGVWPPRPPRRPRLLVIGGVGAAAAALAEHTGVGVQEITVPDDERDAFNEGARTADREIESGADLLVLADPSTSAASGVVVGLLTGAEPVALLPRGAAALDTASWVARAEHLRDTRRAVGPLRGSPDELLAAAGGPALAASAGVLVQAAARRTPVIVDGTSALAAVLLAVDAQARIARWLQVADTAADPVHRRALDDLALRPVLDLGISHGDGTAGLLAAGVLAGIAASAAAGTP